MKGPYSKEKTLLILHKKTINEAMPNFIGNESPDRLTNLFQFTHKYLVKTVYVLLILYQERQMGAVQSSVLIDWQQQSQDQC